MASLGQGQAQEAQGQKQGHKPLAEPYLVTAPVSMAAFPSRHPAWPMAADLALLRVPTQAGSPAVAHHWWVCFFFLGENVTPWFVFYINIINSPREAPLRSSQGP
jgi:hypothetical protein